MCGIFGLINKDGTSVDQSEVNSATQQLHHRGPDDEGFYFHKNLGLGHKRLSIIDLSKNAHQPFIKHDLTLIFNGEIYNFKELRNELIKDGYEFKSRSDTEVILSGYHKWGNDVFKKMNGMWALAIVDPQKKSIVLSRDRYGMKPLFVYEDGSCFAFASEIKAFSKLGSWKGKLDVMAIKDYLVLGKIYHNVHSFYANVSSVEPATISTFNFSGIKIKEVKFYKIPYPKKAQENESAELGILFSEAVKSHYIADVPVALALSGGIDSTSIVMQAIKLDQEIKTFSYAPLEDDYSEYGYVKYLVQVNNIDNIKVSPSFDEHIQTHQKAIIANDAPLLAMNFISSFLLYDRVSKENFKVLLSGQGADELLLGYNYYYLPFLRYLKKESSLMWLKGVIAIIFKYPRAILKSLIKNKKISYGQYLLDFKKSNESAEELDFLSFYQKQLSYGQLQPLLQFEDRVSMAHSVESRLPFLDKDFSQYLNEVPFKNKIKNGIRKYTFRKSMKGLVPSKILKRKDKIGFLSPEEKWIFEQKEFFIDQIQMKLLKHPGWFTDDLPGFIEHSLRDQKTITLSGGFIVF